MKNNFIYDKDNGIVTILMNNRLGEKFETIISIASFELIKKYSWSYSPKGYAVTSVRTNNKKRVVPLHYILFSKKEGMQIDHINQNKLDNRIENLRYCTHAQNKQNCKKFKNSFLKYKGVTYNKLHNRYSSHIISNGKDYWLGRFYTAEKAAYIYDLAALLLHKDFACLNFSENINEYRNIISTLQSIDNIIRKYKEPAKNFYKTIKTNNTTGYKGVFYDKENNKYMSKWIHKKYEFWLGRFSTKEEAAIAYDLVSYLGCGNIYFNFPLNKEIYNEYLKNFICIKKLVQKIKNKNIAITSNGLGVI